MKNEVKNYSIGPGAISESSTEDGAAFVLSSSEWYTIQRYVTNSMSKEIMPHTEVDFKVLLGSAAPEDLSDFSPLIKAYKGIFDHVSVWNDNTFPESVSLASDIVAYANQASIYYNPIIPLAEALVANPNDEASKQKLEAILDILIKNADNHHDRAKIVSQEIKVFADQTAQDKIVLSGPDGDGGLFKYYNEQYGEQSEEVKKLVQLIDQANKDLEQYNRDYEKAVKVASTTPTYGWVFPIGTIAAAITAGVYGSKATQALNAARATRESIKELSADLQVNINIMNSLNISNDTLSGNIESITAALPIIQKIQGAWGAISDDLNNISELIETNIEEALPIIMDLGVATAINEWEEVGKLANAYRLNAYITVTTEVAA